MDKEITPSIIIDNTNDTTPPEQFSITLTQDPMLFNGKYVIIFDTKDKESGMNYYEVKEEGSDLQKGESPYVLKNQPPKGTIFVKAFDNNGNSTTETLTPNITAKEIPLYSKLLVILVLLFFILFLSKLIVFFKRKIL